MFVNLENKYNAPDITQMSATLISGKNINTDITKNYTSIKRLRKKEHFDLLRKL